MEWNRPQMPSKKTFKSQPFAVTTMLTVFGLRRLSTKHHQGKGKTKDSTLYCEKLTDKPKQKFKANA
jgi:hypothetical protein